MRLSPSIHATSSLSQLKTKKTPALRFGDGEQPVKDFLAAARAGNLEAVQAYLDKPENDVNKPDEAGKTALSLAAQAGHMPVLEALIKAGADVNTQDEGSHTPLMLAVAKNHFPVAKALMDAGAKIIVRNTEGKTAFHLAMAHRNPHILNLFPKP